MYIKVKKCSLRGGVSVMAPTLVLQCPQIEGDYFQGDLPVSMNVITRPPVFGMALNPAQQERFQQIMPPERVTNDELLQGIFTTRPGSPEAKAANAQLLARLESYPAEKRALYARHFVERIRGILQARQEQHAEWAGHHPLKNAVLNMGKSLGIGKEPQPDPSVVTQLLQTGAGAFWTLEDPTGHSWEKRMPDLHYAGPLFEPALEAQYVSTVVRTLPVTQSQFLAEVIAAYADDKNNLELARQAGARLRHFIENPAKPNAWRERPAEIAFQALQILREKGVQPAPKLLAFLIERAFPKDGKPGSDNSMVNWAQPLKPPFDPAWEKRYLEAALPAMKGSGTLLNLVLAYPEGHELHEMGRRRIRELIKTERGAVFSFAWDIKRHDQPIPQALFDEVMNEAEAKRPRDWDRM